MEFGRKNYLDKLIRRKHNGLIKVVTGLRRCGKSYLVFTLFKRHLLESGVAEDHIFEMNFDDNDNKPYRDPDVFYPYVKSFIKDNGQYYVLLDEVQLLGDFEGVLNGLLRRPNVDIYVTGSNSRFLSKDVITEFRGRGWEIRLRPLSFSEFMEGYDGDAPHGFVEYYTYGGLPGVVQTENAEDKREYLGGLFSEIYLLDVSERYRIENEPELREILDFLASSIGSLTNPNRLSRDFKADKGIAISQKTIDKYIDMLCDAFIVDKARRYDIKGRRYINTPYKYYFSDMGLRNSRIGFRQIEATHIMENIIYNELRMRGYGVDVGVLETNEFRDGKGVKKQVEVDFVCSKDDKRYYIQSAYGMPDERKQFKEMRPLMGICDGFKKIVVSYGDPLRPYYTEDGILMTNVFDFLLNPNSLEI